MPPLSVAYFTMEIGIDASMPTFAGGLGMLAADLLRSCADLGVPTAGITMCWKRGYPKQAVHADGEQSFADGAWDPSSRLTLLPQRVVVRLENRDVHVAARLLELHGAKSIVPVYFLDTDLPENDPQDREITNQLYGGDQRMRIRQEGVLGIAGIRMLRALGHNDVGTYHMNEGHCAFLTLELLKEHAFKDEEVKKRCAFTTHTPIPAGHDVVPYELAKQVLGDMLPWHITALAGEDKLSTTKLAMSLSHYTCGVSQLHGEVSRAMLQNPAIDAITNGVHAPTWASPAMAAVFDAHLPGWRTDYRAFAGASRIPDDALWAARMEGKKLLCAEVTKISGRPMNPEALTIVEARRIVPYKQVDLLYGNIQRLLDVAGGHPVQIIHSGNTFPGDTYARELVRRLTVIGRSLGDKITVVFLPNYNPDLAKLLVAGADVWCNTPMRGLEASGTSGMKAALNGCLNCSVLDGWWIEGFAHSPEAGWRLGPERKVADDEAMRNVDAEEFYGTLQREILPQYLAPSRKQWIDRMKQSIALLSVFHTNRCIEEYCTRAWGIPLQP